MEFYSQYHENTIAVLTQSVKPINKTLTLVEMSYGIVC